LQLWEDGVDLFKNKGLSGDDEANHSLGKASNEEILGWE
jgi:hypothetical protein